MASAGLVQSWLDLTEVRSPDESIDYRFVSRSEGGEWRFVRHVLCCTAVRDGLRYRTVRHGLLKMVPYLNVALGREL